MLIQLKPAVCDIVMCSELVQVISEFRHFHLEILALPDGQNHILHLACLQWITWHCIPVVKDALWEGLATGLLTQCSYKAERFCDRQMCLHLQKRSSLTWILLIDASTTQVHAGVHAAHG